MRSLNIFAKNSLKNHMRCLKKHAYLNIINLDNQKTTDRLLNSSPLNSFYPTNSFQKLFFRKLCTKLESNHTFK